MTTKGERIDQAIKMRGLKKADLARLLNVPRGNVSNWINGKYDPNPSMMEKIAMVLNVSTPWLYGFDSPISRDSQYDQTGREERIEEAILISYRAADPKTQSIIRKILEIDL